MNLHGVLFPQKPVWSCLFGICIAVAATANWSVIDPGGGGWCYGIYPHPTDSNIVWMNTDISGLFKSTDGGATYTVKSNGMHMNTGGGSVVGGHSTQFAIDPSAPTVCYYAAHFLGMSVHNNGLWKSTDGGDNWSFLTGTDSLYGASIAVDYNGVVYCARSATKTLWVSTNKGSSFTQKSTLPITVPSVISSYTASIRMAVSKSNRLFVADPTTPAGLYYTDNNGDTWTAVSALAGLTVGAIACSPTNADIAVAATSIGALYHTANGSTFSLASGALTVSGYSGENRGVGVGIDKNGRVVGWGQGMAEPVVSDDNGATFSNTPVKSVTTNADYIFFAAGPNHVTSLAASPCGNRFYKTTDGATFVNLDNGADLTVRVKGISVLCQQSPPVPAKGNPNRVLFFTADLGYYYTTDLGSSWKIPTGTIGQVWCKGAGVAQDPAHLNTYYMVWSGVDDAVDPCYLYQSVDSGVSWTKITTAYMGPRYRELGSLIVDPGNPAHLFYSTTKNSTYNPAPADSAFRVWESNDAGGHFHVMPGSPLQLHNLALMSSGNLYGVQGIWAWNDGVYKYTKSTGQWTALYASGATDFAVDPTNENTIFVADFAHGKLYKSTTGGSSGSFVAKTDSLGRDICAQAVYIDPIHPNVMLVMAHDVNGGVGGIMRSMDSGEHWSLFNAGNASGYVNGFTYGGTPGRVYTWSTTLSSCRIDLPKISLA